MSKHASLNTYGYSACVCISEFAFAQEKITNSSPFGLVDSVPCERDPVETTLPGAVCLVSVLICFFLLFQVYANGIRNIDLHYIVRKLAAPVICVLLLSLCVPYVIASGVVPLLGE